MALTSGFGAIFYVLEVSAMYAIIRTGGKQYRVKAGDVIRVEKFDGDLGSELDLTDVMFVGGDKNFIGTPVVKDAKVTVVVTNQARGPKLIVFKKKRRQGYRRTNGHRTHRTERRNSGQRNAGDGSGPTHMGKMAKRRRDSKHRNNN